MVRERFGDTSCCFVLSGVALVQLRLGSYAQMLITKRVGRYLYFKSHRLLITHTIYIYMSLFISLLSYPFQKKIDVPFWLAGLRRKPTESDGCPYILPYIVPTHPIMAVYKSGVWILV